MAIHQSIRPAVVRGSLIDSSCDGGCYREYNAALTAEWTRAGGIAANVERVQL